MQLLRTGNVQDVGRSQTVSDNVEKIRIVTKWLTWPVLVLIACSISAMCFLAFLLTRSSV